jgi:hypothetical protein
MFVTSLNFLLLTAGMLRKNIEAKDTTSSGGTSSGLSVLDNQSALIAHHTLNCLSHLFSWMPMLSSAESPPTLFDNIFRFAAFGCQPSLAVAHSEVLQSQSQLGETAMSCINELLGKNRVPADCEHFLMTLFSQTYNLLQCLTGDAGVRINQLRSRLVACLPHFEKLA